MTQNANMQEIQMSVFVQNRQKSEMDSWQKMARNGRKKGHLTVLFIFTQTIDS